MTGDNEKAWWSKTRGLMISTLMVWIFFGFVIHMFVGALNNIAFLGIPLGYFFAAQGSLIAFVILAFWFAARQNAIDTDHGMAEDQ